MDKNFLRVAATAFKLIQYADFTHLEQDLTKYILFAKDYGARAVLFPEYSLTGIAGHQIPETTFKKVTDITSKLASIHDLWILGLSGVVCHGPRGEQQRNRSLICGPNGEVYHQDKLHLTSHEDDIWKLDRGDGLVIFEMYGIRACLLICLDIEFAKCAELAMEAGAELIFVPSYTDDVFGFHRVKICCQARCVEYQLFVIQSVLIGSLPTCLGFEQAVGSAGIYSPIDVGFPDSGILAQTSFGLTQSIVAELSLDTLRNIRKNGTVQPLKEKAIKKTAEIRVLRFPKTDE